jgi:plasmid stabilization system protein ParE
MKIVWRRTARAELDAIVSYIAKESPAGAVRVRDQILHMITLLQDWPDPWARGETGLARVGRAANQIRGLVSPLVSQGDDSANSSRHAATLGKCKEGLNGP